MDNSLLLLGVGALLAASVIIAHAASRLGVSFLVALLGVGMLLGTGGPGGIHFDNAELARSVGIVALALILFEGGLSTSWRRLRQVAWSATLLSTIGVFATAFLTGLAAHILFDLPWLESLLLGAVVSSTDAAAVFATLRFTHIRLRVARVLEAETGGNDPVAIALTIGLIALIEQPSYNGANLAGLIVQELGIGLIVGLALGYIATKIFSRLPQSLGAFAPVASLAACAISFGLAGVLHGSGFLAVYIVGLAVGSTPSRFRHQMVSFHEGLAFLAQVIVFIVLGLLVVPQDLVPIAGASLILALLLIFIIRPIAVYLSIPLSRFSMKERFLIGFAGLRGAVPIVLGTFVLTSNIPQKEMIFNVVFFVVVASALIQGASLERLAKWLGLVDPPPETDDIQKSEPIQTVIEYIIGPYDSITGVKLKEIGLPRHARVGTIKRGKNEIAPGSDTRLKQGDRLFVITNEHLRPEVEDVIARWRRRV